MSHFRYAIMLKLLTLLPHRKKSPNMISSSEQELFQGLFVMSLLITLPDNILEIPSKGMSTCWTYYIQSMAVTGLLHFPFLALRVAKQPAGKDSFCFFHDGFTEGSKPHMRVGSLLMRTPFRSIKTHLSSTLYLTSAHPELWTESHKPTSSLKLITWPCLWISRYTQTRANDRSYNACLKVCLPLHI